MSVWSDLIPEFDFEQMVLAPWTVDFDQYGWILLMGFCVAFACGLVGNFIVVRRMALVGDAISHSLLPGIVLAFMLTASLTVFVLLAGAAAWLYVAEPETAGRRGRGGMVTVEAEAIANKDFADVVEALGTARAVDSIIISSKVTETVAKVHFDDGQKVSRGDMLVTLTNDEEKAQFKEAQANLVEAKQNFDRIQDLVKRGNASTAALDEAERRLSEVNARLEAARARLNDREIRAPFDGVLGLRDVSTGSLVTPSSQITTMDALTTIYLDFQVPERFISVLNAGQKVEATVAAYPDRQFSGLVKSIDSRVDPNTRSVIVRAEIANDDMALLPGMLMTVSLTSREWRALSLPEEAVVTTGGRSFVFVVAGDKAERRNVTLGLRRPGYVEVTSGVAEGEQVVTKGTQRLGRPGMKVRILGAEPSFAKGKETKNQPKNKNRKQAAAQPGGRS